MTKWLTFSILGVFALAILVMPDLALAQSTGAASVGENFGDSTLAVLKGNWGTLIGLAFAVLGLYTWLVKQDTTPGLLMIGFGIALTAFPGLFASMQDGFQNVFSSSGATTDQQTIINN